jgi:pilus assembly protein CpaB
MRVDVLVTGRPPETNGMMTTTALQNIIVLSAGQTMQSDARGQAINAPTVTLLVTPDQAEVLTLAGNEGRIQLVLRNGSDQGIQKTAGRDIAELFGRKSRNRAADDEEARPRPRPVRVAAAEPPPVPVYVPPPPPPPDEVITFRGTVRSVEVIGGKRN